MNEIFLPKDLLLHFTITDIQSLCEVKLKRDILHIYLEEKNELPQGYSKEQYESKGFYKKKQYKIFLYEGKQFF